MAEFKKVKAIPVTLTKGTGKKKEVYTHFISLKSYKGAQDTKKQITPHYKKVVVERLNFKGEDLYCLYMIRKDA